MRQAFNLFMIGLILFFGNRLFPNHIHVQNLATLIIVALGLYIIDTFVAFGGVILSFVFFGSAIVDVNLGWLFIGIGILFGTLFGSLIISLAILVHLVPGFAISGGLTYVLLAFAISIFSVQIPAEDHS